ncbi:MAG: cell division protein FtsZ, partial [Verrucomicrobia bacterium]|nr:cell division protein FtsZ [Verrucomicrobiota bacterium]
MTDITSNSASSPGRRIIRIRVLGVGGAGCNAVEQMAALPLEGVDYTVLNTDQAALQRITHANRQLLGPQTTRGLGAGGEPERGRKAAEEDAQMLRQLCDGADLVFIVAGMGGGTGTGAAPVVARIAREAGALAVAIAITPFHCEGVHRQKRAASGLQTLRAASDSVICLPNEKILAALDEKTQLSDALRQVN